MVKELPILVTYSEFLWTWISTGQSLASNPIKEEKYEKNHSDGGVCYMLSTTLISFFSLSRLLLSTFRSYLCMGCSLQINQDFLVPSFLGRLLKSTFFVQCKYQSVSQPTLKLKFGEKKCNIYQEGFPVILLKDLFCYFRFTSGYCLLHSSW